MNTVNIKTLLNGPRMAIVSVYLKSDGASGELDSYTLIDPALLGMKPKERLSLDYIAYNFAGFDACIEFASGLTEPTFKWVISEGTNHPIDFRPFGGLLDDSGMDGTGQLQITTTGFTSSVDQGSMIIQVRKV